MKTCKKKYSSEDDLLHYMKIYEIKLHFALFSIIHSWNEVSYLIYDEARKKQQQKKMKNEASSLKHTHIFIESAITERA